MNKPQPNSVECREIRAEACSKQISAQVFNKLREFYLDISPEIIEHAVNETLYTISFALRRGEMLSVEAIGEFIPCQLNNRRLIRFHPAPSLFQPMSCGQLPVMHITDGRHDAPAKASA